MPPRLRSRPDKHVLYQRAVQEPEAEIEFFDSEYRRLRKRTPNRLREDFCGTGLVCCAWARKRRANIAVGLDLDQATLDWGRTHNVARLRPDQRRRVTLLRRDVRRPGRGTRGFDIISAGNFSWWALKTRADLLMYFRAARRSLARGGLLVLDTCGGWDSMREVRERSRIGGKKRGFWYTWQQRSFDPITGNQECAIHFSLDDGTKLRRAFTYDWRLWTIPETREALADAGFRRTTAYWEGDDGKGGGNGEFRPAERGEALPSFLAYIIAER